jgi:type III restriction enzyme
MTTHHSVYVIELDPAILEDPNVFQICTLNETHSVIKKRQEIGRGLRIPVNQDGERVFDESINKLMVVANESYEEFARALQTEYEEDCGVTFGKISRGALAKIVRVVDDTEEPIGQAAAGEIWQSLVTSGMITDSGKIQAAFDPARPDFALGLAPAYQDLNTAVIDLVSNYRIERHVRNERQEVTNRLKKEVQLTPEFAGLWSRIKPRTTYRVEFDSNDLVNRAVAAIKQMQRIQPAQLNILYGDVGVGHGGVRGTAISAIREKVEYRGPLPDILAYLQNQTELTRSTLARILKESRRLAEFFVNPQRFMDTVAGILKYELHRLLVAGVKYERIPTGEPNSEWEMMLFHEEELVNYLTALAVNKSVYPYIPYDSSVERDFAEKLDQRTDIKLFVKLPDWFKVETPVGTYNPDWAIVKHDDETVYLVRETKDKKDFLKLRTTEADKVRCGAKHFEAIGVPFKVAVTADEV